VCGPARRCYTRSLYGADGVLTGWYEWGRRAETLAVHAQLSIANPLGVRFTSGMNARFLAFKRRIEDCMPLVVHAPRAA
jgi:hypothetical protein